jgi:hypothetical protein
MKTKIKDFMFVADAFGPIPLWSLQNVLKGADDAYSFIPFGVDKPVRNKRGAKARDLFKRLNDTFPMDEIFIDGEVEWKYDKKMECRSIVGLIIDHITIYPNIDKEEIMKKEREDNVNK